MFIDLAVAGGTDSERLLAADGEICEFATIELADLEELQKAGLDGRMETSADWTEQLVSQSASDSEGSVVRPLTEEELDTFYRRGEDVEEKKDEEINGNDYYCKYCTFFIIHVVL